MSLDNTNGKLVRMANQIATFFKSQPESERVEGVATHINKFWEPRMRKAFFELVDQGDAGFDPIVLSAAALIKQPYSGSQGVGTGSDAAAGAPEGKGTAAGESLSEPSIPEKA